MLIAIVLVLLVLGSILFHFLSPWWLTPLASNWGDIDDTITITFWVTGFVFIAVNLFMAYCLVKYRHRPEANRPAHYEPENKALELWLTIITAFGVAAMLAPGLYVWNLVVHVPDDALQFEAVGEQWRWTFRLPGEDGKLGSSQAKLININNPFGLTPQDPAGQDDIIVFRGELHLPIDQPVKLLLRSKDVLHDFAVPQFRVKMDLVPGSVTYLWFTPTRTGSFEILCEELCGVGHFTMRGRVVVESAGDFEIWKGKQITFAESQSQMPADIRRGKSLYAVCGACHGAVGEGNAALNAPPLGGQHTWYLRHQIQNFKLGLRGAHKDDEYGKQMAPIAAMLGDEQAIYDVSAFISQLPGQQNAAKPGSRPARDLSQGESLYSTCGTCHGKSGEGNYAAYAPRLNNQPDWYLRRQLKNFKTGIRGSHADDMFGAQMRNMTGFLRSDDAIDDVVAYITQLEPATTGGSQ